MSKKRLLYYLIIIFLSSMIITSCSSSRTIVCRAIESSGMPSKCAPFEFQINIDPMDISAEREVNCIASSTDVFGALAKSNSYVDSIRRLGKQRLLPSGKLLEDIYIPSDKSCEFYMISYDDEEHLSFANNRVAGMTNCKNYLWAKCDDRKGRGGGAQVHFSHLSALLEIIIEGLDEMKLTKPTFWLTPPNDANVTLDLATGLFSPAITIKEVFEPMKMNGTIGRLLIVPLKQVQRMEVKIMATEKQGNNKRSKCVSGILEVPFDGFKPGFHYSFTGIVEKGIIYFSTRPTVSKREIRSVVLQKN